jgi:hypothetical protein
MSTTTKQKRFKGRRRAAPITRFVKPALTQVPDLDNSLVVRKRIRYISLFSQAKTFTNQQFADFLAVNTDLVGANMYRLALSVRVIKISLYAQALIGLTSTHNPYPPLPHSIQWISSVPGAPFGGPAKIMSCTPLSPGNSAVHSRPPPESYAAQWINCQNNVLASAVDLVTLNCAGGDVVDITYEFVINTTSTLTNTSQPAGSFTYATQVPIYALTMGGNSTAGLVPQQYELWSY